jgi:hypothetical protein
MDVPSLGLRSDPNDVALSNVPPAVYAMHDTPWQALSQDNSWLFCYQEKFALRKWVLWELTSP